MATAVTTQHFRSGNSVQMWDHDPGTTAALITSPDGGTTKRYVELGTFRTFFAAAMTTVLGGNGITLIEIVAATDAAGTNATVVLAGATVAADAAGDWTSLEVTAEQVNEVGKAAGYNFTHVGLRITCHHAGDEAAVLYIRSDPKWAQLNLTPVSTIA